MWTGRLSITRRTCRIRLWRQSAGRGLEFYLESNNGLFASEHFETAGEATIQEYSRRKGKPGAERLKVRDAFPEMIFGGELYRDDLNKVSYILNSYDDFLEAQKEFPDLQNGTWGGEELKAEADYVTDDVDKDGLYKAFAHLGLI